jgi:3-hydroxyisobutyrate dehydrogenase-like beta-hydroxyacid dehydrogenase
MRVGFFGLGNMGIGMVRNLLAAGHDVTVFNRTIEKARPLEKDGAKVAAHPRDLAGADVVVTMLADDAALEAAALEGSGLAPAFAAGALHLSMSTVSVALARRLTEAHARAGGVFVSAPVFGRPEAAAGAKLFIVAAGPPDAVDRCRPLLSVMGQKTFVVGDDPPVANVLKLAGNFLIAATIESMAEAFALARKSGVDAEQVLEMLTGSLFTAPFQKNYAAMIARGSHEAGGGFALELGLKDLRLVLAAADAARVPMPTASLVHNQLTAGVGRGLGALDWSALGRLAADNAGL